MERRAAKRAERIEKRGAYLRADGVCRVRSAGRRGLILPVVLMILALLGLLAASFSFQVNADYAATQALVEWMQTRLAAEAGFHYVTLLLRESLNDVNAWHDNEEKLRGVLVWSSSRGQASFGEVEDFDKEGQEESYEPAYRFSIVADDPADDEVGVRYGITDESSKLNINKATAEQLTTLIAQVVPEEVAAEPLVAALLDWRDADEDLQSNGAESEYYRSLRVPYRCKNAPFDTVEELLMVRGFTGQVLYGEDADRNGLLSLNENDGELTFPPDNEDDALNRGLYPYVTVYSVDYDRAADNQPRVPLAGGGEDSRARLEKFFSTEETDYLLSGGAGGGQDRAASLSGYLGLASTNGASSPFELEDFPRIVDRCTLRTALELPGLININTAPAIVLRCLGDMTEAEIAAIVEKRAALSSESKQTTAWLLTEGVLDQDKYDSIANYITARGLQFNVEVIGYGDHVGSRTRLQIVFALRGPVPQIVYYRDLTNLGATYPLRREEEEEWSQASDGIG